MALTVRSRNPILRSHPGQQRGARGARDIACPRPAALRVESLRFTDALSGYRYLGIKLASFTSNSAVPTTDDELAVITFYNAVGVAIAPTITLRACNPLTANSATSNFFLDAGQSYRGFSIAPIVRADGFSSTLRVGSVQFCSSGTAAACIPPSPSATNCP